LCGIEIPCEFGPVGHSDADVPLHALMDAMLGALALGDIGRVFPDTEEQWRDADSICMLKAVYSDVKKHGYTLGNADITIVLQAPRISNYIDEMRGKIADSLGTDISRISVKATTEENMGFTGDGTGMSASAFVLLEKK